jgi:outer membrane protein assembly complex protein YaeT
MQKYPRFRTQMSLRHAEACATLDLSYHDSNVRSTAFCLFLFGIASAQGQDTTPESFEGRPIVAIEYSPDPQPLPREQLDRLVPLQVGSPLHAADVRAALQALYLTGRYHDASIEAVNEAGGVRLRIVTELNFFTSGVRIHGEVEPPNASQLSTAAKLPLGEAVQDAQVEVASRNVMDRLRANGLYSAQVVHRVERIPATQEAIIFFDIDTGDRAHFDGVQLTGQFTKSPESIVRSTNWRRGLLFIPLPGWRQLTENRVQTGIQSVLRGFQKGNRLEARVTLTSLDYHPETNRVTPSLDINAGPVIEVRTTGAKVSQSRLRQLIPIFQERAVDRTLLVEGRRNLVEYFQSLGYFDADADFAQTDSNGAVQGAAGEALIEYRINRGVRHKLARVDIAGNRYFDQATLRERLYIQPASLLQRRYGRFSQRFLEQDKTTLRDLYHANGFRTAEVTSAIVEDYGGTHGNIAVTLTVTEGPQWLVNRLAIAGVSAEDVEYLRSTLQSTEGQPFSEANIASDRDAILSYYYNNGYPDATFDWTQSESALNRVDLSFEIKPGPRQFVRGVLVSGLETTNPDLVQSRISLGAGDPISQNRIAESQQKLYDLGIFAKVQTAIQNPTSAEDNKYVLFHMDEARKYSFNFGVGAEIARIGGGTTTFDAPAGTTGFSPRVTLGVSRINFLGLGHTVGLQGLASTLQQRVQLTYTAPQFKGQENLALSFSARFDDSRDVRTFTARRWEGSVQLAQRISRANTVQYRYVFRRVNVDENTLNIEPGLIPLLSQPVRVGLVGFTFIQDRRDDPIDSRQGIYNTADVGIATRGFGSETDFFRLLLRNSTYHRLKKNLILARSVQFGYQQRLGGLAQIPLAERFFSGGASTHRAFPDNQAGPRDLDTGFPLGGTAVLTHSTELRFPLIGDNVGGVLFHDMGNVYSDIRNFSVRFHQRDLKDFDYMVHGVGFGIRYRTPVGPIRVDFSLSPNSPRFFGFAGTRDQLLAGEGTKVNQRINVFQFHFSLGQTF